MGFLDIFFAPFEMALNFLTQLKIGGVSMAAYIVAFVLIGVLLNFLRGGSND